MIFGRTRVVQHATVFALCHNEKVDVLARFVISLLYFSLYAGHDFCIFEGVYRHHISAHPETLLAAWVFCDARFVLARDLGCQRLGRSIHEVLQTVICAMAGTTFCPNLCGCADGELDRESSTSSIWTRTVQANVALVNWVSAKQKRSRIIWVYAMMEYVMNTS